MEHSPHHWRGTQTPEPAKKEQDIYKKIYLTQYSLSLREGEHLPA